MPDYLSPLEMARNAAAAVHRYAEASDRDHHFGEHGHLAAQLAAAMALVSIAEDIHQIARDVHVMVTSGEQDGERP